MRTPEPRLKGMLSQICQIEQKIVMEMDDHYATRLKTLSGASGVSINETREYLKKLQRMHVVEFSYLVTDEGLLAGRGYYLTFMGYEFQQYIWRHSIDYLGPNDPRQCI